VITEARQLLKGVKFPIHDGGHVVLMDFMGSDADIVQAARTSYQTGTKHTSDERTLLRYLMRHRHSSPFESAMVKLHIKLPIVVERQWCLAGRTELHFDSGVNGNDSGKSKYRRKASVDDLYRAWQSAGQWKVKRRFLRKLNLGTGEVSWTHIKNIWRTGKKAVFRVAARIDGFDKFEAWITADHPFYTNQGWKTLEEFCKLPTADSAVWESAAAVGVIGRMDSRECKTVKTPVFNKVDESTEVWTDLSGWGDVYQVSSQGRVRGVLKKAKWSGRIKSPVVRREGNYQRAVVTLFRPGGQSQQKVIARAMMESFYPDRPVGKDKVCHKDGNPFNNVLDNLKWGDADDNTQDSITHGTHAAPKLSFAFVNITEVEYCGVEETYDIEVTDDDHNFVAGGFVVHNCRHRTAGWNEVSGRYSELPEECYLPVAEDVCYQSSTNRQGRDGQVTPEAYAEYSRRQHEVQELAFKNYKIDLEAGIARETARNSLPLSTYTEKVWWMNLHNLFHFLGLRMESHAQKEIRDYATVIGESIVSVLFPESWAAFVDYRLNAMALHGREIELIAKLLASLGKLPDKQNITDWMPYLPDDWKTIRCRERDEFFAKLQRLGL